MLRFRWRSPEQRGAVTLALCLVALATGVFAAVQAADEIAFERHALRLDGVVTGQAVRHQRRGDAYAPIFRFTPPGGVPRDVPSRIGSRPAAWAIGDRSVVMFDPAAPAYVVADTLGQRWGLSLGFGAASLVCAVLFVIAVLP